MPKTEKPRWRPRVRPPGPEKADDADAPTEGDAVFAAGGPLEEKPGRRPGAGRSKATQAAPRRSGPTIQPLTDDTLRTLLIGQEGVLNKVG
jgi:hypothetical protein